MTEDLEFVEDKKFVYVVGIVIVAAILATGMFIVRRFNHA